jgi:hypothetical protein
MTSMLVFAIAFAVGCLSGVVIALWPSRGHADKPDRAAPFWRLRDEESTTVQRVVRR